MFVVAHIDLMECRLKYRVEIGVWCLTITSSWAFAVAKAVSWAILRNILITFIPAFTENFNKNMINRDGKSDINKILLLWQKYLHRLTNPLVPLRDQHIWGDYNQTLVLSCNPIPWYLLKNNMWWIFGNWVDEGSLDVPKVVHVVPMSSLLGKRIRIYRLNDKI